MEKMSMIFTRLLIVSQVSMQIALCFAYQGSAYVGSTRFLKRPTYTFVQGKGCITHTQEPLTFPLIISLLEKNYTINSDLRYLLHAYAVGKVSQISDLIYMTSKRQCTVSQLLLQNKTRQGDQVFVHITAEIKCPVSGA